MDMTYTTMGASLFATGNPIVGAVGTAVGLAADTTSHFIKQAEERRRLRKQTIANNQAYYRHGIPNPYADGGYNQYMPTFKDGGPVKPDYDMARAKQLGYTPDASGHMPSRDYRTGMALKMPWHPTFHAGIEADRRMGYLPMVGTDGKVYTQSPNDLPIEGPLAPKYAKGGPIDPPKNSNYNVIGRSGGSRSWRNNNPGNIEYGDFAKKNGAIDTDGRFAIFPSEEAGAKAQEQLIFGGRRYKDATIRDAISIYAPSSENDTESYVKHLGFDPERKISSLSAEERVEFLARQRRIEGWKEGEFDPSLKAQGGGNMVLPVPDSPLFKGASVAPLSTGGMGIPGLMKSLARNNAAGYKSPGAPGYAQGGPVAHVIPAHNAQEALADARKAGVPAMMVPGNGSPVADDKMMNVGGRPIRVSSGEVIVSDPAFRQMANADGSTAFQYQQQMYPSGLGNAGPGFLVGGSIDTDPPYSSMTQQQRLDRLIASGVDPELAKGIVGMPTSTSDEFGYGGMTIPRLSTRSVSFENPVIPASERVPNPASAIDSVSVSAEKPTMPDFVDDSIYANNQKMNKAAFWSGFATNALAAAYNSFSKPPEQVPVLPYQPKLLDLETDALRGSLAAGRSRALATAAYNSRGRQGNERSLGMAAIAQDAIRNDALAVQQEEGKEKAANAQLLTAANAENTQRQNVGNQQQADRLNAYRLAQYQALTGNLSNIAAVTGNYLNNKASIEESRAMARLGARERAWRHANPDVSDSDVLDPDADLYNDPRYRRGRLARKTTYEYVAN